MASITLILDTAPPANPALVINEGEAITGRRAAVVRITSSDQGGGSLDVEAMKIWGDVDPNSDPDVQALEGDSAWVPFVEESGIVLSTGSGRKHIFARLRDDVFNESLEFTDFIDLDLDLPVVEITEGVAQAKISRVAGHNLAVFTWQSTRPFTDYQTRVVPSSTSPVTTGVAIGSANNSENVADSGTFPADTPIDTTITGQDLAIASPGNGSKVIKVFVKDEESGDWSR